MAFGMTTILLNLANAGIFGVDSIILSMGIFFGGLAQVIAGILEYKRGNTFGTVAFISYGMFWESFVFLNVIPLLNGMSGFALTKNAVVCYLALWGFFTFLMFFGTLKLNRGLQVVFFTLFVLYGLLAAATYSAVAIIGNIAGYEGIFVGCSAMYVAIADILNEVNGHVVLPVGPVKVEPAAKTVVATEPVNMVVAQPAQPVIQLVIQATQLGTQPLNRPYSSTSSPTCNSNHNSTCIYHMGL